MASNHSLILFCFCGPAGSGKSTICQELVRTDPSLTLSVSTTTRAPRGAEQEGIDYFFVSEEEFASRVAAGRFIEYATFGGHRYGTEASGLKTVAASGRDVLLDIDVQGAQQLKKIFPGQTVTIFVFPPSYSELVSRLRARGTDTEARIAERLRIADLEIARLLEPGFSDYLLINSERSSALDSARVVIAAERQRLDRFDPRFVGAMVKKSD